MLDLLGNHFNFKIITRDRDSLEDKPYENVKVNEWNDGPNCQIFYADKNVSLRKVINEVKFDQYYLNSLFDYNFSIKILLLYILKLIAPKPVLLAPRGELMEGALSIKSFKKRTFLIVVKVLKLYKNIIWHASSEYEAEDIRREFGAKTNIKIAIDPPNNKLSTNFHTSHKKEKGKLKILFISSIVPKKNLKFAIRVLNKVKGDFTFDIYGPINDLKYWKECVSTIDEKIKKRVTHKGVIPNDQIHTVYPNYDLFFFPTLGENYGHVIYESLFHGCPVLCTAGKTPWDKLDSFGAGWNLNITQPTEFVTKIEMLIEYNLLDYQNVIEGYKSYLNFVEKDSIETANIKLFA